MISKPITVIGCGAMACLISARLAHSAQEVNVYDDWLDGLNAIASRGIQVRYPDGSSFQTNPIQALHYKDTKQAEIQTAIVFVKSWQTKQVAEFLFQNLAQDGLVITLQNGLGNYEILSQRLGKDRVVAGTTTLGATLLSAGVINAYDQGDIHIGIHPKITLLIDALQLAGFHVNIVDNLESLVWGKVVVNSAANPLSALLQISNGEILDNPFAFDLFCHLIHETSAIAECLNIPLPYANPIAHAKDVLRATAGNHTSMYQDWNRGAETEIDAINGAVIEHAKSVGIPTPYNQSIYLLIKAGVKNRKSNDYCSNP